ncbi:MAG: ImmA/IrrE family metallo-endopeptidase [Rhizobiaceae bacterium]|nr:ImmA/IrrE family metallo-endopeptidase [Rhizobiaceae bacterium]
MTTDEITVDVIERFQRSYPVPIKDMARALGIRVIEKELPNDVSGKIVRDWSGTFEITANAKHSTTRRRFTIAHEIAHYILHRDLIGDGIVDTALYRSTRISDSLERQANRYAATLLMPRGLVCMAWKEGINEPRTMASAFEVSTAFAEIRYTELGCTYWRR